jgi:hypothetical protein
MKDTLIGLARGLRELVGGMGVVRATAVVPECLQKAIEQAAAVGIQ